MFIKQIKKGKNFFSWNQFFHNWLDFLKLFHNYHFTVTWEISLWLEVKVLCLVEKFVSYRLDMHGCVCWRKKMLQRKLVTKLVISIGLVIVFMNFSNISLYITSRGKFFWQYFEQKTLYIKEVLIKTYYLYCKNLNFG